MTQQRLIGVITYIDYDKGFGFLSTNGYGIDKDDLNDKIQLYFKISSLENPEYIFEGDWVTFIFKKNYSSKHKRDNAISIRLINFDNADYLLSLQYRGLYANIFVRLASSMQSFNSNVSLSITNLFIEHSKYQIVVNTLTNFYQVSDDETRSDIINALSNSAKIQKLLLDSEWGSDLIENINRNTILIDMALCYINKYDAINFSKFVYAFNYDCIRQLAMPCITMLSEGNNNVNMFFSNLGNDVIEKLFKSDGFNLSPEFRDIVFRKLNDVSVILDDSVIRKWNTLSENDEENLHRLWSSSPYNKYLSQIAKYISNSQIASDYLKFTTFVEAKNTDCLLNIQDKDYNFCLDWIARQSDRFISEYFGLSQHIPQISVILDEFVIKKWNQLSENNEEALHNLWNRSLYGKYLSQVAEYISNSQAASDYLKFTTFVEAKNINCLLDIKDKDYNFCLDWIAKQSDRFISEFIRQSQHIPDKTVVVAIQKIGYERVANICNAYHFSSSQEFFNKFCINLIAIANIFSKQHQTELKSDEGIRNEECVIYNCSFNVYAQSECAQSICVNDIDCKVLESMNGYPIFLDSYWIICITDNAGEKRLAKFSIQFNIDEPQKFFRIASYGEEYIKDVISLINKNFVRLYEHFHLKTNYFVYIKDNYYCGPYTPKADKCIVYFLDAIKVGSYRGEDSGAWYPEYDDTVIRKYDITSVLDNAINIDGKTIPIKDLCYNLARDGANWPPYYRHETLMGFLLSHPELILTE